MTTGAATALPENLTHTTIDGAAPELLTSPDPLETTFNLPVQPAQPDTPQTSLGARVYAAAAGLEHRTLSKLYVTSRAIKEDVTTSEHKAAIVAAGIGYFAIKAAGKFKLPGTAVSIGTMDALTATHSPLVATAAAFTASAAWSLTASAGVDNAINHYSGTVGTITQHFPKATKSVAEALPGLNHTAERDHEGENTYKWLGRAALTHLQRGFIASNHLTNYVMAAGYSGQPQEQRRRFRRTLSLDAAAISAGMYGLVSETVMAIEPHDPNLAENIQEAVKNPFVLSGVSLIIIAGNVTRNIFRRRKANKSATAAGSVPHNR